MALNKVKNERYSHHTIKRRKTDCIGHILLRNYLMKHVIEGMIEEMTLVTGRRRRGRKQIVDDLEEKRGYGKLKEEALDRSQWRTGFGRGYGPVVRRTKNLMNYSIHNYVDDKYVSLYSYFKPTNSSKFCLTIQFVPHSSHAQSPFQIISC